MTDHTALIAELLEHAEWEDQRRSLACADVLRRAAMALENATNRPCHHGPKQWITMNGVDYVCAECGHDWHLR